jgi:hypothetical protein
MATIEQGRATGTAVAKHEQPAPGRSGGIWRLTKLGLGAITWVLLAIVVLAAAFVLFGVGLALVILHSGPARDAAIIAGVLVVVTAALCWVVAHFFASGRTVRRVVALLVALMVIPGIV